jgi:peptide/nickel transport system substrate-binding protein
MNSGTSSSPRKQKRIPARRPGYILRGRLALLFMVVGFGLVACSRQAKNDELIMVLEKKVTTLDPRVSTDSADERLRQLLFNSLTKKNAQFEPVGDLAESFSAAPDFKTFTFKLRQSVSFHDGRPFSSRDVKYTFDSLFDKSFQSGKKVELSDKIDFIEAPDPQTVIFRFKVAVPGLANIIVPIGIIPEGSGAQQSKNPVGSGPFKFVSYAQDQEVVLAANEKYFDGRPTINSLRIRIVPDNSTRESELRKGSADLAINADFDPVTVEALQKAAGVKVTLSDGTNVTHLGLNMNDPILKDQRVRQAIAYALDREAIIRDLLRGQARPATSVLPPSQWAFEPGVTAYNHDPEKAKQLLDAAGRKAEVDRPRFKMTLKTRTVSISRKTAEVMQEQLRRVGIELEIQSIEPQKFTQDVTDGNFQMYLNQMVGGNQSTDIFRYAFHSQSVPKNGQNRMRYNNPKVDKLLDESTLAPRERQKQIFSEVQKTLADELPMIYLWYPSAIIVARDRVTGLSLDPSGDWSALRNVKLSQ